MLPRIKLITCFPKADNTLAVVLPLMESAAAEAAGEGKIPVIVVGRHPKAYSGALKAIECSGIIASNLNLFLVFDSAGKCKSWKASDMQHWGKLDNATMAVVIAALTGSEEQAVQANLHTLLGDDKSRTSPVIVRPETVRELKEHLEITDDGRGGDQTEREEQHRARPVA